MSNLRNSDLGVMPELSQNYSPDLNLKLFEKMSDIRYFEFEVCSAYHEKKVKMPVFYLSAGSESIPAALSLALLEERFKKKLDIFAQHRAHGYYIAFGGDLEKLVDELLSRPTGCAGGMGGSASIHCPEIGMYGHDGLMGSNIPIGVGYALGKSFESPLEERKLILAVAGDAAMEEDYAQAAIAWTPTRELPVLFVCEDNNYSVMTKVDVRRKWKMASIADSYGLESVEISDDPWTIMYHAKTLKEKTPSFLNIQTCRYFAHNFGLPKQEMEWDRFQLTKQELTRIGLGKEAEEIDKSSQHKMEELWKRKLAQI